MTALVAARLKGAQRASLTAGTPGRGGDTVRGVPERDCAPVCSGWTQRECS
jgi:hypothetical protein